MELTSGRDDRLRGYGLRRIRHRYELGMTLMELLVTMTILATIVGSIAGAFTIGLHVLNPANTPARLTGNNDLIAFEQVIGADVNRAVCLASPGPPPHTLQTRQTSIPTGGCASSSPTCGAAASSANPTGYLLCLAWYVPGTTTCHTVTYAQMAGSGVILRSDSAGNSSRVGTGSMLLSATWAAASTTTNGYQWTWQVVVTLTQQGTRVAKPQTTTLYLAPLVADPLSPAVPGASIPC
jgi:prepilin-type N-terminal cleavage/methylation domain-containing protein